MATAAGGDPAPAVDVVTGRAAPPSHRMHDRTDDRVPVEEVVGGEAFDGDAVRAGCPDRERNWVERLFAECEPFRRVATRYEKLRAALLGMVRPALGSIRLRKSANVNTP